MKILITTDWYKPVVNGVVTSVENLAEGLTQAGHEVRVFTLSGDKRSRREGNVYYAASIGAGVVYPQARLKLPMPRGMEEEILAWRPDVIHSQCEFSTFAVARRLARTLDIPLVHTYHTVYEDFTHYFSPTPAVGRRVAKVLSEKIVSGADAVIAPTEKTRALLERYGVERPIYVIPTGIRLERYLAEKTAERAALRAQLGIGQEECMLLYAGRLAKEKNIEEIFALLKKVDSRQRLLIVGGGPYREELDGAAERMGIRDRLIFTGMVPPERMAEYYALGDIFVNASSSETQGLTYMEAMASALPLLCRADDCLVDVIEDGENGLLYRTEEEFLHQLERLRSDGALRARLGGAARESMRARYSVQAFAASCAAVYETLSARGGETEKKS